MEQQGHSRTRTDSPAMEGGTTAPPRVAADRQFHLYIAAKLENKVLSQLITELLDQGERPRSRASPQSDAQSLAKGARSLGLRLWRRRKNRLLTRNCGDLSTDTDGLASLA